MALLGEYSSQELLQGQLQLWHQSLGFFKSLALVVAMDLRDDECVKILKNCKQAIPPRAAGGKVIIIDMVVGSADEPPSPESDVMRHVETQVLFDLLIMSINGVERDEQEWKSIFSEAGFQDYRIIPVLGVRSIIELYP